MHDASLPVQLQNGLVPSFKRLGEGLGCHPGQDPPDYHPVPQQFRAVLPPRLKCPCDLDRKHHAVSAKKEPPGAPIDQSWATDNLMRDHGVGPRAWLHRWGITELPDMRFVTLINILRTRLSSSKFSCHVLNAMCRFLFIHIVATRCITTLESMASRTVSHHFEKADTNPSEFHL